MAFATITGAPTAARNASSAATSAGVQAFTPQCLQESSRAEKCSE